MERLIVDSAVKLLASEAEDLYIPSTIERIEQPTALQFYRDYVSKNIPVIIAGAIDHWPALEKWTDEYLTEKMSGQTVTVAVTPNGRADAVTDIDSQQMFVLPEDRQMNMGDFLKALHGQKEDPRLIYYLQQQNNNFRLEFEPLQSDVDEDIEWAAEALGRTPDAVNLWIGSGESVSSLHKDNYENLYGVVAGTKIFTLIPPTDMYTLGHKMYKVARYQQTEKGDFDVVPLDPPQTVPWIPVDPDRPDLQQHPKFQDAHVLRAVVRKGEILYLPALWYHQVSQKADESGRVVAVNYWYDMDYDLKYIYYRFMESLIVGVPKEEPEGEESESESKNERERDAAGSEDDGWPTEGELEDELHGVADCPCCIGKSVGGDGAGGTTAEDIYK